MTNHLLKRGSRYYIRRKIPLDLQVHYQGRKEIVKALRTADPVEARRLVREESVKLDREFDVVRAAQLKTSGPSENPASIFDPVSARWYTPRVITISQEQADEMERNMYESADLFEEPLDVQFENHDRQVALEARRRQRHERQVAAYEEALRRISQTAAPPPAQSPLPSVVSAPVGSSSAGHLAALVEQWAKERKPDIRTSSAADLVVRRFYDHVGRIPVASITRAHVIVFKDKLLESGQTPVNTDKQLTMLRALLNFAVANLQADSNAAQGVKVGERKNARAARLPFDLPALRAIFSSPVYAEGERPEGGAGEAAYWLPLLGLFTGARIEELCQLRPEDIYEETYSTADGESHACWILRITDEGEGQGLKNATSIRRVPVHRELLTRGFLEYVDSQRGRSRIFPALKPDNKGAESGNWSKWFSKQLRDVCRVENKKMVFHSFRHLFKDLCRNANIPEEVSDALSGHSSGRVSRRYGGLSYPLAPLVDAIARIRVPGLALPR